MRNLTNGIPSLSASLIPLIEKVESYIIDFEAVVGGQEYPVGNEFNLP